MEVATINLIITTIIAGIVAYVGVLQYQTNKRQQLINEEKFKLDLFDKRFKVYEATKYLFTQILQLGNIDLQKIRKFRLITMDAVFLFDDEIHKYLEKEIHLKALKINNIVKKYKDLPEGSKKVELCREQAEIVNWFRDEYFKLQNVFSPYLKFKVWK
ncbi:MAG: hypothetical protein SCARUB_02396 [Candidatus Scalindua rubra]|uniref:Uncharacterized protein n=1 Tax=Candidatus Scalindua rubra TaxID=1872076 RepID=A0A1E3XA28_9BACT|nr:MAG: hypothetical protein SCARUB_02396 [Candidatus Scalindua rubra]